MKCWVTNGDHVGILGENIAVESGKKTMSCLQIQWRYPLEIVDMFLWVNYLQVHTTEMMLFQEAVPKLTSVLETLHT